VDDHELLSVLEREPRDGGELAQASHDELAQGLPGGQQAVYPNLLVRVHRLQLGRVDGRDRAIGHALNADRLVLQEEVPGFERFGAGKQEIATHEQLLERPGLAFGDDGPERRRMSVHVRNAEKSHERRRCSTIRSKLDSLGDPGDAGRRRD
jgi:hypothetical protein